MSCRSCSCALPPPFPMFEFSKKCLSIPTTHGSTYCEIYYPNHLSYAQLPSLPQDSIEILVMVHGLGGSLRHFSDSDIPAALAQGNAIVVTFDLYTHGKSEVLSNKTIPHNTDIFITQLYDVIHSTDLFLHKYNRLHLLGFSFGGWTILNYLIKFHKNPSKPCCQINHCINKIIFQSPWNGNVPLVRGLLHVPGALRLFRPSEMAYINDFQALKHILLYADREKKFHDCIEEFAELILNHDEWMKTNYIPSNNKPSNNNNNSSPLPGSPSHVSGVGKTAALDGGNSMNSTLITDSLITVENNLLTNIELHHTASEVLFLSGTTEFFFTNIAKAIRNRILKAQKEKIDKMEATSSSDNNNNNKNKKKQQQQKKKNNPAYEELERRFPQRICRRADHLTFVNETNLAVGQFYRENICEFLLPKFHIDVTEDQHINPQHSSK